MSSRRLQCGRSGIERRQPPLDLAAARTRALQEMPCCFSLVSFLSAFLNIFAAHEVPLIVVIK
jgi:hypothetical protein